MIEKHDSCTCRWCQFRTVAGRRRIGHTLALQLYRRATKRLMVVFSQLDDHLRVRREKGDALLTMRDFMQACFKWGSFLEYVNVTGKCFGDNFEMRRLVLKMIGFIDRLNEYPERSDYKIAGDICSRAVAINSRIAPLLSRHRKYITDGEKIELTVLKKNMGSLVKLRNTWTNAGHRYFEDEVPQFSLNCAHEPRTGMILYFEDGEISQNPLDLLARIAASRLIRMYNKLLGILERLGGQDIFLHQIQQRMDYGCMLVESCLYGGQENKNADQNGVARTSGSDGIETVENSAESGDAGERERGVA